MFVGFGITADLTCASVISTVYARRFTYKGKTDFIFSKSGRVSFRTFVVTVSLEEKGFIGVR
jgi:hypothetical protein